MTEWISKYQKAIVGTGAVAVLVICYFQQKELSKLRTEVAQTQEKASNLHDELFQARVEAGRYELTFEHLKEVNPKLGKEMEDWMSHETE